jgi:Carboxypeptidase regulatory-like domain/TonB-dependent Receptor Plug Domain
MMMKSVCGIAFSAVLLCLYICPQLGWCSELAILSGRITDPHGLPIIGVGVRAVNIETNVSFSGETNDEGLYTIANLPPGSYRVIVTKQGFVEIVKPNVELHVADIVAINFSLQLGSVTQSVTVESGAPQLQTESAALGRVTDRNAILGLPLSNRNFTQILDLSPGVTVELPDAGAIGKNTQNVSVNGVRTTFNNFEFNGIDANNLAENSASGFGPEVGLAIPAPDTIAEFKVQTGNYDASSGRSAGANVDLVSKTGTNDIHGDVWEFFRNTDLDANDFFRNRNGQTRPVLLQNQFGATIGGPLRRNKTFFFGSYQGTRQRNGESSLGSASAFLPPLTGDRSAAVLGAAFGGETGVGGGVAVASDGSNINPVALALLQTKLSDGTFLIPTPQVILPRGGGQSSFSIPAAFSENQYTLNIDQVLSARNILSGRFFYADDPQSATFAQSGANVPGFGQIEDDKNVLLALTDTHAISPTFTNEAKFGFARFDGARTVVDSVQNSAVGITSPTGQAGIPRITVTGLFTLGPPVSPDFFEATNIFDYRDTLSKELGRHHLRFGVEFRRSQVNVNLPFGLFGSLSFLSFPDFLLGMSAAENGTPFSNIRSVSADNGLFDKGQRYLDVSGFAQDDFKLTPTLTFNLGLRYDVFRPPSESQGRFVNFDPSVAVAVPGPGGSLTGLTVNSNYSLGSVPAGVTQLSGEQLWSTEYRDVSPRFGFAYRPFVHSSFVVRGGYGIYFQRPGGQFALQTIANEPFVFGLSRSGAQNAASTFQIPIPGVPAISEFPIYVPRTQATSLSEGSIPQDLATPYAQTYSLGAQKELPGQNLVEVGFVGSQSRHLSACIGFNQALIASPQIPVNGVTTTSVTNLAQRLPFQGLAPSVTSCGTSLDSNFNSLQASVTKRLSAGLEFLASYTWSKSLDFASGTNSTLDLVNPVGDQTDVRGDYGPSAFDRTHRFVLSFVYDTPSLRSGPSAIRAVVNHWTFSGILLVQSGLPFSVTDSRSGTIFGFTGYADCTDVSPRESGPVSSRLTQYFNPAAFAPAPRLFDGTGFGNCGRNILRGPSQSNLDLALHRMFPLPFREGLNLEFRTEAFNLSNTPKFGLPGSDVSSRQSFGVISTTVSNPRILQLALKLNF